MADSEVWAKLREQGRNIQSADDLLAFLMTMERAGVQSEREAWNCLDLNHAKVIVTLRTLGPHWDRRIDWRAARLIQETQQGADKAIFQVSQQEVLGAAPIKVEAKSGSNLLDFDLTQFLVSAMASLTPDQFFMLCKYVIAGGFSVWGFKAWSAHTLAREKQKIDRDAAEREREKERMYLEHAENIQKEMTEVFGSANFISSPMRHYVSALGKNDSVAVGRSLPVPMKAARKLLAARRQKASQITVHCDGQYYLTGIKLKQEPPSVILEKNDMKADGSLFALVGQLRAMLIDRLKEAIENKQLPLKMDIQADAICSKTKILGVNIVGMGIIREGDNYDLSELPGALSHLFEDE